MILPCVTLLALQGPHSWTDPLNAVSTAVIALFTVFLFAGVIAQIRTSREIERAWVMADLHCSTATSVMNSSSGGQETTAIMEIELQCRNSGNSPAWIIQKRATGLIVAEANIPETPKLTEQDIIDTKLEPVGPGEACKFRWTPTAKGRFTVEKLLLIYGVVYYRDIFNKRRETWFCYYLEGFKNSRNLVRLADHPRYNKHA